MNASRLKADLLKPGMGLARGKSTFNYLGVKGIEMTKPKNEHTSKAVASKASKILSDKKSTKVEKSVAASALTQARNKKKSK